MPLNYLSDFRQLSNGTQFLSQYQDRPEATSSLTEQNGGVTSILEKVTGVRVMYKQLGSDLELHL